MGNRQSAFSPLSSGNFPRFEEPVTELKFDRLRIELIALKTFSCSSCFVAVTGRRISHADNSPMTPARRGPGQAALAIHVSRKVDHRVLWNPIGFSDLAGCGTRTYSPYPPRLTLELVDLRSSGKL